MTDDDKSDSIEKGTRPLPAFNARSMSVKQVVDSFVVHDAFARLRRPVNTLLSGPRGSGKTTLMKMLQPMALELWTADVAQATSDQIEYSGVFIPTDRTWKRQLEPKTAGTNPFLPELGIVANAAFSMHVLRELIIAMQYRMAPPAEHKVKRTRAFVDSPSQSRLVQSLARVARIKEFEPSFDGLIDAITIRLADLRSLQNALRDGRAFPIPEWIQIDCLAAAQASIDIFNRAAGEPSHQWALLFDEMELAPTAIVTSLLDAMRGLPENLLLKLSLSPVQPELAVLHLPYSAVHGQDFELIQLNYARQADSLKFGRDMLISEIRRRKLPFDSIPATVGHSLFSSGDEGSGGQDREELFGRRRSPYARNSSLWKRYNSLAQSDDSFKVYLERNEINLTGLDGLSPMMRAAKLRKVRNLVVVRQFYRGSENRRRSRKSYELYTGADTILAFCDGNARLLTALIGQLLSHTKSPSSGRQAISAPAQSQAIDSIIRRFFALVYSAEAVTISSGGFATLADLVHRIGESLSYGVVEADFNDNVPLTFTVDKRVNPAVIRLLHLGINVGAFVHIPRRPDYRVPLDLDGEQFRLTYVLAPYFGLPVRLGRSVSLSTLLSPIRRTVRPPHSVRGNRSTDGQVGLFDAGSLGTRSDRG